MSGVRNPPPLRGRFGSFGGGAGSFSGCGSIAGRETLEAPANGLAESFRTFGFGANNARKPPGFCSSASALASFFAWSSPDMLGGMMTARVGFFANIPLNFEPKDSARATPASGAADCVAGAGFAAAGF